MLTKSKYYHHLIALLSSYAVTQADLLLLEKQWFSCPTLTLALYVYFLYKQTYLGLVALFLFSIPFSLIHYHLAGLQLLFYVLLVSFHVLFQNSIRIKKAIPLLLALSFLLLQELYFCFFAKYELSFSLFFIQIATSLFVQSCFLYMFDKKKETP